MGFEETFLEYLRERHHSDAIILDGDYITYAFHSDGYCFLADTAVHSSRRGTGQFSKLFGMLVNKASENNCKSIYAKVWHKDPRMNDVLDLARHLGFKVTSSDEHSITIDFDLGE